MSKPSLSPSRNPRVFARAWSQSAFSGLRQAGLIALCAAVPALIFYCTDGAMHARTALAQPVPAGALWIDARPATDYVRGHVPGALNLNTQDWEGGLAQVFATWQPPRPIVVYCSAGCSSAADVTERLIALGLEPVKVYEGGLCTLVWPN